MPGRAVQTADKLNFTFKYYARPLLGQMPDYERLMAPKVPAIVKK